MIIDIDPSVDFACKMILGNPSLPEVTIHFLNAVLRLNSPIVSVEILNPIVNQEFESDKLSILDIMALDDANRRLNIEVQRTKPTALPKRLAYYTATQFVDQIGEGEGYRNLRPSIGICILKATLFNQVAAYHQEFRLRSMTGLELTDCLEIHTLELPKYLPSDDNRKIVDPLDQWMYFFQSAKGSTRPALLARLADPIFERAIGVLELISRTPDQRRHYDARLKWEMDERARLEAAFEEGEARGEAKGRLEGEIRLIRTLEGILGLPPSNEADLQQQSLEDLQKLTVALQDQARNRA